MFIDSGYIENLLENAKANQDDGKIIEILKKSESFQTLSADEVAALLACTNPEHNRRILEIAGRVKEHIYGNRIVMFAPIYVSDYCVNGCTYCNYNCDHKYERRRLTTEEVKREVLVLEKMGHKRLALEAGEDEENCPIEYILKCIETIYAAKAELGEIRRINVNIAATTTENYKKLKNANIGTYILFQETYHKPTYKAAHPSGPKSDFDYHLTAFDRAIQAGVDDVGAGVLFGLYEPFFEVLGLLLHNEHLEKTYGVGFHTISVPRICKTDGAINTNYKHAVDYETFRRIVAILRLAMPFTGIILSTRESPEIRKELIHLGVSQISASSSPGVGAYSEEHDGAKQFEISDKRRLSDIVKWLIEENLVPSFCTACYRKGRTGGDFMNMAKSGQIKNVCHPNALMTLCEYAKEYMDEDYKGRVYSFIGSEAGKIPNTKIRGLALDGIERIKSGERDLYI